MVAVEFRVVAQNIQGLMREFRLIKEAIKNFDLDLTGLVVLTEAASGNYVWTPIIAALSGAKVYAFSKDSRYGRFDQVKKMTNDLANKLNILNNLLVIDHLTPKIIGSADIITNTGFLRPLNREKLQYCKEKVVIPLMYESWEFRDTDIEIDYCKQKGIPVYGTNESDERVKTIEYLGMVAKKALLINNIEVFSSRVAILGVGKFANAIYDSLNKETEFCEIWSSKRDIKKIDKLDALIIADHETETSYLGQDSLITIDDLHEQNPDITIIHVSGKIDKNIILKNNLKLFPHNIAPYKWMSLTTDFVGPKPLIDLHTAGLKVVEVALYDRDGINKTLLQVI